MTTRLVGAPVLRGEDERLVTGQGRYLDDLGHDALAVAFVHSPHAAARVLDVDVTDALDVDGLVAIYTYDDLPPAVAEPLPVLIPHPALHAPRTGYALVRDVVRHVGEPVVMVIARDRYVAEDVCGRIRVDYEPLPAVVGVAAARAAERLVHADLAGNVSAHLVQETGDVEAALAGAEHVLELDLEIERSASTPLEGRGSTRGGTPPTPACASTPRRRPRRACAPRSPPGSGCRSARSSAWHRMSAAASA